jgi:outer membrane protein OmpA-like peptidoglycan-associated protein
LADKVAIKGPDRRDMRFAHTLCVSLLLTSALAAPASAQRYPGDDVTVNSSAIGRGYLLYPGGRYGRSVRHLLQPGERPGAIVHLHMPVHHRIARATVHKPRRVASATPTSPPPVAVRTLPANSAPPAADASALPEDSAARLVGGSTAVAPHTKPPTQPVQPTRAAAATPPPPNVGATMVPFSLSGGAPVPVGPPAKPPKAASAAAPPARPVRTASTTPPPAVTAPSVATATGMKRQSSILFPVGESSPAAGDVGAIHALATSLNAALSAGASRIQLDAFGGPRGDKSSDSRRLSLKRALVVRELLIEDGVPSEKIDVRAMGGVDDSGVADRVDVFVRA